MKETAGSLRAYFILCALGQLWSARGFLASPQTAVVAIGVVHVLLALAYGFVGVRLPVLLRTSVKPIFGVLAFGAVFSIAFAAIYLLAGNPLSGAIVFGVGVAVSAYLYVNVKRPALEAQKQTIASV